MKDVFKNYHKQKVLSHLGILAISGVLAISINMFVLSGSSGEGLKANLQELQSGQIQESDISINNVNNSIQIRNSLPMNEIKELSFSFAYNSDLIIFGEAESNIEGLIISTIETTPGFSNFIVVLENATNLDAGSEIINIPYSRIGQDTIHLNPVNMNFTDTNETNYSLTSSSLIF